MKTIPEYSGTLRSHLLTVPKCISECSGIRIFGRRIKSLVFSTDVAIIKNVNADAIIAVYPFTPQPSITQAIISVSEVPVFVGVGVGLVVRAGGAAGGDDALALVISKKLGWRLPMAYLATDLTVLLLSLSYIPPVKIACSLVTVTISSFLIGKLEGRGEKAQTTA